MSLLIGVQVTYTSSPSKKPGQKFGLCKWCKKSNVLQNFTSSDGEKETSCKDLCSALCFEQAVKSIKENQSHINNTQQMSPTIKPGELAKGKDTVLFDSQPGTYACICTPIYDCDK